MCAQKNSEPNSGRAEAVLTWLGGGHWRELGERHERSTAAIAGVVVLVGAALTWLVATVAVAESTQWPVWAILPLTLLFGLLVGAVSRAAASGPTRGWAVAGRGAVAALVGLVVGELAAVVLFSGSIDRRIDEDAARSASATPAVAQAEANLGRMRDTRTALDTAVEQARAHRDQALVVARCEFNPTPGCPQTRITGVPGSGPETRSANQILRDTQRELDNAVAVRDQQTPALNAQIAGAEQGVTQSREAAVAAADRGLGARWVAMHAVTLAGAGALVVWAVTVAFFALLSLLPLILKLLRGETSHDRGAAARAQRDRAELNANTAIAVKRAEVRAAIETIWAEQQLASARLAVEAQHEIDRELHRRRVVEALDDAPVQATLQRPPPQVGGGTSRMRGSTPTEPGEEDMYLPIAAEAEAASRGALPAADNLPARVEDERTPARPTIPNVTKTAARWIRPLVPPIVARAIDTTTHPLRTARQVFEEVEEITFSFKRTHKVTVFDEETPEHSQQRGPAASDDARRVESSRPEESESLAWAAADEPYGLGARERQPELGQWDSPGRLRGRTAPRELPSAE
ncbi:DUF4407 domain-containing protein [Mycobacterium sp.]|uniref:DUF4407 domain-containing protein n=1 Tax=Mycobacterium sp. TaxID=1785 RepID=UPI003C74CE1B